MFAMPNTVRDVDFAACGYFISIIKEGKSVFNEKIS